MRAKIVKFIVTLAHFMDYVYLIGGMLLLIAGGKGLVNGAVDIANRFKVPSLIIGMTIVAMGTSAPELIVSTEAAIQGHSEMSLGNVIGSNIANIGLILGLTALVIPLALEKVTFTRDMPFLVIISLVLMGVMNDGIVSRLEGVLFVALIICYTILCIKQTPLPEDEKEKPAKYPVWASPLILIASIAALAIGSSLLIEGASGLARAWGISERVISITIVAFGTSIPELVTSIIAAAKRQADIAVGNIVGSNIFNILFVLGVAASINPIDNYNYSDFRSDLFWMLGFALALLIGIFPMRRYFLKKSYPDDRYSSLGRISGGALLVAYIVYVAMLF